MDTSKLLRVVLDGKTCCLVDGCSSYHAVATYNEIKEIYGHNGAREYAVVDRNGKSMSIGIDEFRSQIRSHGLGPKLGFLEPED